MTYANGVHQRQIGPRNSLDYWNKSEDWQGVTTYYRGSPVMSQRSPYGMENIYAQTPRVQRPAPFPLNLPVSKAEPRRMPLSQRSPSAPETGNYQNVPPMARIRQQQQTSQTVKVERKPSPPKDSPIFSTAKPQPLPENSLIWSVGSHHHHLHNNHVAPISNSPQITRVEVRPQSHPVNPEKNRTARSKPKWGRFMRTLCCCVAPEGKTEKLVSAPPSNPALLITQVQKNGTTAGSYPSNDLPITQYQRGSSGPVQISDTTTKPVSAASPNEYSPAPAVISQISPKTGERHLLPQLRPADSHKKCLIIDLDETLVHSSFKPVKNADFVIPVEIDGVEHKVYVLKRPYVDEFLERVGERFECVLFTASLAKYADPVADLLDKRGVFRARLFREACVYHKGNYVKDLARLGRDLHKTIIIDNSPASYAFHPENALPVQTWFDDPTDCELLEIIPLLERMDRLESVYHATTRNSESPTHILERS